MAYNVFPHSSSGVALFYSVFGWDAYMPILFKLLFPNIRYMGDKDCRIHLDAMRNIYMMMVHNLKTARDKCLPPINDPSKTDFKAGDMVQLKKKHTLTTAFDIKYKTSNRSCK